MWTLIMLPSLQSQGGSTTLHRAHYSTVPGGKSNTAGGDYSLAAGFRAQADHDGSFDWADSTDADFASTAEDQFLIRASGGVGIGTTSPQSALQVNGYTQLDLTSGAPPAADCGAASARRMGCHMVAVTQANPILMRLVRLARSAAAPSSR